MLPSRDVVLLNQICALSAVKACDYVEGLVVEGNGSVEIAASVQTGDLRPCVTCHVIYFALIHRLAWQRAADSVDTRSRPPSQDRR